MPACFIVLHLRSDICQIHGYVMLQNKLSQIYATVPSYSTLPTSYQRKTKLYNNRLRIGHTRLTHSYTFKYICDDDATLDGVTRALRAFVKLLSLSSFRGR